MSVIALVGGGTLVAAAQCLNWMLSWRISIRGLGANGGRYVRNILCRHYVASEGTEISRSPSWRAGWPIEELRDEIRDSFKAIARDVSKLDNVRMQPEWVRDGIRDDLKEIARDVGKLENIERTIKWLREGIREDFKHEIQMHEMRTGD